MRLFLLTTLTMMAFAANSILNRMALAGGHIDAVSFGTIRLASGALMLALLCVLFRGGLRLGGPARLVGVVALLIYMYGFSSAYTLLDAGLGALILFGMVQITMFAAACLTHEDMPALKWIGAALALVGLAWLIWPGPQAQVSLLHGGLMAIAGIGWGFYSLAGRKSRDALQATAANFVLATPFGILALWVLPAPAEIVEMNSIGIALAILAGTVTSGLGYALWYSVLPSLASSVAAVAQLTVPVIALLAGVLLLGEVVTLRIVLASALILGGVALSVLAKRPG
ncbi:MAG: DMT family transporter [Pseudomonadota bacterium]